MSEIKNCPFCGGEAEIGAPSGFENAYIVICSLCGVKTRFFRDSGGAIAAWNRREPEPSEEDADE